MDMGISPSSGIPVNLNSQNNGYINTYELGDDHLHLSEFKPCFDHGTYWLCLHGISGETLQIDPHHPKHFVLSRIDLCHHLAKLLNSNPDNLC